MKSIAPIFVILAVAACIALNGQPEPPEVITTPVVVPDEPEPDEPIAPPAFDESKCHCALCVGTCQCATPGACTAVSVTTPPVKAVTCATCAPAAAAPRYYQPQRRRAILPWRRQ